jgi:hypothetical protein
MDAPKSKLRWFQFQLRTLFVLVFVVALALGWFMPRYRLAEKQRYLMLKAAVSGWDVFNESGWPEGFHLGPRPPLWYEAICGRDRTIVAIEVRDGKLLGDEDVAAIRDLQLQVVYDPDLIDASALSKLQQTLPQTRLQAVHREHH